MPSKNNIERVRALRDKGQSLRAIARETGMGYGSVARILKESNGAGQRPSRPPADPRRPTASDGPMGPQRPKETMLGAGLMVAGILLWAVGCPIPL